MSNISPAFLPPAQLHVRRRAPLLQSVSTCRSLTKHRLARVTRHHRTLCVAQEEKLQPPASQLPSNDSDTSTSSSSSASASASLSGEPDSTRKERARNARMEAERLEIMAAKARLEFERAELHAERKRLELDKARNIREIEQAKGASVAGAPGSHVNNPYDTEKVEGPAEAPVKATVKVGANPPKEVTAGSLSDLLSAEFPRVSEADIEVIKEKLCGMDTFFVTEVDRSPFDERVVLRGNMRMDATKLLDEMEARAVKEGISERVRFFILIDPKESPNDSDGDRRPVLVALPAAAMPNETTTMSYVVSVGAGIAAFATMFSYGIGIFGMTPDVITQIAKGNLQESLYTLPLSVGGMAVALAHDVGHRVMGRLRNVKLGLPFFIPSLQIGNFGIITPLESYPRLRKDLFDVAIAGPIAGSAISFVALLAGLIASVGGDAAPWFPHVPSALFHASILVGSVADVILPAAVRAQATVAVHPLVVVGYTGLLINALNLMPIGRLDGGRIVQALYGRVAAGRATAVTLLVQVFGSLFGNSPLLLFWGLVCVFLQRESDFPCLNEVLEPDNNRTALGLGMLAFMLLVLVPFPDQIGAVLGQ